MFVEGGNETNLYDMWNKRVNNFLETQKPKGMRKITTHDFRTTTATNLYNTTKDIMQVKRYLGHASIENTKLYIHEDWEEIGRNMGKMMKKHD